MTQKLLKSEVPLQTRRNAQLHLGGLNQQRARATEGVHQRLTRAPACQQQQPGGEIFFKGRFAFGTCFRAPATLE
jgi:hypothetical protein